MTRQFTAARDTLLDPTSTRYEVRWASDELSYSSAPNDIALVREARNQLASDAHSELDRRFVPLSPPEVTYRGDVLVFLFCAAICVSLIAWGIAAWVQRVAVGQ